VTSEPIDGGVLLRVDLVSQGTGMVGVVARWMKTPSQKTVELEEIGALVWQCSDGQHSFETIAKKLRERFRMSRLESESALAEFVRMLQARNLVAVVLPSPRTGGKRR